MMWTMDLAKEMKIKIDRDAAALIIELTEDPEEIRGQLLSLSLLKKEALSIHQMLKTCVWMTVPEIFSDCLTAYAAEII